MAGKPVLISMRWKGQLQFEGGPAGRPPTPVDADSRTTSSPVELLVLAAVTCTGADVVGILEKMRVKLTTFEAEVRADRREEQPRCLTAVHFRFRVVGEGADETKVRRAVDLSLEKYCSVMASLKPDIAVSYDVVLS